MRKTALAISILAGVLVLSAVVVLRGNSESHIVGEAKSESVPKGLTSRSPIYIDGNAGFTAENGVSNPGAAGTKEDPYIIIVSNSSSLSKYAVLVGIEDYPGTSSDLLYCVDDIYDTYELLVNFCGFPTANIRILTNQSATKSNIQNAIDWLAENVSNNDTVVFYYSGHGMSSGRLAQYDYSTQGGISNAELDSWLDNVNSSNMLVSIDCCFAGAFSGNGVRCIAEKEPYSEPIDFARGIAQEGRVICMACGSTEYSWEFDDIQNGAFTYYFTAYLQDLKSDTNRNDNVSCEEAFEYTIPKVVEYVQIYADATQTPQIYDGIAGELEMVFFNVYKDILIDTTVLLENESILLRGNLTVISNGALILANVAITLLPDYDGEFCIDIEPNAKLEIYNSSLTTWDYNKHFLGFARNGSSFKMENSKLEYCGYNYWHGGFCIGTDNATLKNCSFSHNFFGLTCNSTNNTLIENCSFSFNSGSGYGLILINSTNTTINNSTLCNNGIGLCLDDSKYNYITACQFFKNNYGIWSFNSSINAFIDCCISENYYDGIKLDSKSDKNIILNCTIYNNSEGIYLHNSSNNNITNCMAYNNSYSIKLASSSNNNIIKNCNLSNNGWGVLISDSSYNALFDVKIWWNSYYNLGVSGQCLEHYNQTIDTSNIINGLMVYYYFGLHNVTLEGLNIAHITFAGCTNITLKNSNITGGDFIKITYTESFKIESCCVSECYSGIDILHSTDGTIKNCTIHSNKATGIYFFNSSNIIVKNCDVSNNYRGISLGWCYSNCTISNCSISNNGYGIQLQQSSNNNITNCAVYNNQYGIYFYDSSDNNILINCNIYDNLLEGVLLSEYANNNRISNNNIFDNGVGIFSLASSNTIITNCVISNNSAKGIALCYYSNNNIVTDCTICSNNKDAQLSIGIAISESINNLIVDCNISYNYEGVCFYGSDNNSILNCRIYSNYDEGIHLVSSSDCQIVNSTIDLSCYDINLTGLYTLECRNTTFNKTKVYFADANSTLNVSWYLSVNVLWQNNASVENATAIVEDNTTDVVFTGMTDLGGGVEQLVVREYTRNQTGIIYFIPYTVTASKSNISNFIAVNVSQSQNVVVILEDSIPPSVIIVEPPNNAILNSTTVIVHWVVSDNESGRSKMETSSNGINWTEIGGDLTWWGTYMAFTSDGNYIIYIRATDKAGNKNVGSVNITIDTTAPTITITELSQTIITTSFTMHWSTNATDIQYYEVSMDGSQWINVGTNMSYTFTNLSEGTNVLYVRGTDKANNTGSSSSVTIIVEIPISEEVTPSGEINWLLYGSIIVVIFLVLMLAGIGITEAGRAKRRRIFSPQIVRCIYCQETMKITSRDRPLLFQCPKCGGKNVIR